MDHSACKVVGRNSMGDHRNTANNAKETNMESKEIGGKIDYEFRIGFATIRTDSGKRTQTRKTVRQKQSWNIERIGYTK